MERMKREWNDGMEWNELINGISLKEEMKLINECQWNGRMERSRKEQLRCGQRNAPAEHTNQLSISSIIEEMELMVAERVGLPWFINEKKVMGRRPLCRSTISLQSTLLISASAALPYSFSCPRRRQAALYFLYFFINWFIYLTKRKKVIKEKISWLV